MFNLQLLSIAEIQCQSNFQIIKNLKNLWLKCILKIPVRRFFVRFFCKDTVRVESVQSWRVLFLLMKSWYETFLEKCKWLHAVKYRNINNTWKENVFSGTEFIIRSDFKFYERKLDIGFHFSSHTNTSYAVIASCREKVN